MYKYIYMYTVEHCITQFTITLKKLQSLKDLTEKTCFQSLSTRLPGRMTTWATVFPIQDLIPATSWS
jgi:hypothetical protein